MSKSLAERAMLVDLTIGYWQGRKKDKQKSVQFAEMSHANTDAGSWWTQLVPKDRLKGIRRILNLGRRKHKEFSLPWNDNGERVLPAEAYFDYMNEMRILREQYNEQVDEFIREYPMLVEKAQERLGDLFKEDVYPSAEQLKAKFYWDTDIYPLPNADDFRVDLQDEEVEQIRSRIEERVQSRVEDAVADLWQRLHEVVSKAAESLKDPDKIFRNSLIDNIDELCDILPKLNVTNDPKLEQLRKKTEQKVANAHPGALRQDKNKRRETANNAKQIVKEIEEVFPCKSN